MNKNEMMAKKRQGDIVFKAMLDMSTAMHDAIIKGDEQAFKDCLAGLKAMRAGIASERIDIGNLSYDGSIEFLDDDIEIGVKNAATAF